MLFPMFPHPDQFTSAETVAAFADSLERLKARTPPEQRRAATDAFFQDSIREGLALMFEAPAQNMDFFYCSILECAAGAGPLAGRYLQQFFDIALDEKAILPKEESGTRDIQSMVAAMGLSPVSAGMRQILVSVASHATGRALREKNPTLAALHQKQEQSLFDLETGRLGEAVRKGLLESPKTGINNAKDKKANGGAGRRVERPDHDRAHWQRFVPMVEAFIDQRAGQPALLTFAQATLGEVDGLEEAIFSEIGTRTDSFWSHVQTVGAKDRSGKALEQQGLFEGVAFLWGLSEGLGCHPSRAKAWVSMLGRASRVGEAGLDWLEAFLTVGPYDEPTRQQDIWERAMAGQPVDWIRSLPVWFSQARLNLALKGEMWPQDQEAHPPQKARHRL